VMIAPSGIEHHWPTCATQRNPRIDETTNERKGLASREKVGDFCCPASPVPLESPSVARWGPTALQLCNFNPLGSQLRSKSERLVIVGTCVNEPSRWSHTDRQSSLYCTRRSYFAPISSGGSKSAFAAGGGGAGVLPPGSE